MLPAGMNPWWSILMLVLVLALIPAGGWLARRLPGLRTGNSRSLTVLESMNIGPRERVMVIRAGTQTLVIGATTHSVSLLATLQEYPAADAATSTPGLQPETVGNNTFSMLLNQVRNGHRST